LTLWFHDEARFGQKGRVCHRWFTRGQRPSGFCDQRYTWAHLFAAVRPATGEAFALVLPHVSTAAMNEFLAQFAATRAVDEHAVMVLDGAGWHTANALRVPDNVTLVLLPAYSPELMPVERVWLYLRERHLIPTASKFDRCPVACGDGTNERGIGEEGIPCVATGIADGVVGVPDLEAEQVRSQVLPDVFSGIEFGRIGRQRQQCDVIGHAQSAAGLVPSGAVEHEQGVGALGDLGTDLGEVQAHRCGADLRHGKRGTDAAGGADGAEQPGGGVPAIA
jgi:transposase